MASALADAFRADLPCGDADAAFLARLARERVPRLAGTAEDSDEDLVTRLRDPRVFGAFAESVAGDAAVPSALRSALLEHVFDLLPLPRTEGEVIEVGTRAPRRLLALAASLAADDGLSVLHIMHLVYAVFLDRSLVLEVPRKMRSAVLHAVLATGGSGEALRVLYGALHLATVPETEAAAELARIVREPAISTGLRRALAFLAVAEDGGREALALTARQEGLLPQDSEDSESPEVVANIPRLPEKLAAVGRRFLETSGPPERRA